MHRSRLALLLVGLVACGDDGSADSATNTSNATTNTQSTGASATGTTTGATGTSTSGQSGGARPYRDEWRLVVDAPFPLTEVKDLTIGRQEYMENFANRGDIEVYFDLPEPRITVEMRRYAYQQSQAEADTAFSSLHPWAYVSAGSPQKPSAMDPADSCETQWKDGCSFYVYYDGQSQPPRTGADLRVHLPAAYRQRITLETEDNTVEPLYPLRGDVRVRELCGSASVQLRSGVAEVHLCRDLSPGPTCSPDAVAACESWTIDDGQGGQVPAPWDPTCPCASFGALEIEAAEPHAGTITVDLPASVWAYASLDNRDLEQSVDGEHCTAAVDLPGCGGACAITQSPATPWKLLADLNFPGPSATPGAGYSIRVISNRCGPVAFVDGPEDHDPDADAPSKEEKRGDLLLCDGCLE